MTPYGLQRMRCVASMRHFSQRDRAGSKVTTRPHAAVLILLCRHSYCRTGSSSYSTHSHSDSHSRQSFQRRQINHRGLTRSAAHFQLRSQAAAHRRSFRLTEYAATIIFIQLHATHARRFAIRHLRNRRRNRRCSTTSTAIGATMQ